MIDEPKFFDIDSQKLVEELKADYEAAVGFSLAPAQAEMLLINAFAYRLHLLMIQANEAAKQNLLAFAKYPMLDYLGELVGVSRSPASAAKCIIQFNLVEEHPALIIPKGIRIQSIDGKVVFITLEEISVVEGVNIVTVKSACTTEGIAGNDYQIADIGIILDPQAFVASALNTAITFGGLDAENDERLRDRIRLAPSSFSCAGPRGAYIYFAKTANINIVDVSVTSPVPGTVNIYPLLINAVDPTTEIINQIYAICNDDKVRPLTDTVNVIAPTKNNYAIEVNLTLLSGAISEIVQENAIDSLNDFAASRKAKLGVDAVISQIIKAASVANVYNVEVISPAADVIANLNEVAFCTGVTVNISGYSDE